MNVLQDGVATYAGSGGILLTQKFTSESSSAE